MSTIANPFTSLEEIKAWGRVGLSNTQFPGIVVAVDGVDRPIEWVAQNGIGLTGAALIFKGTKLVEGSTITCELTNAIEFNEAIAFNEFITTPPGTRPRAHPIVHPAFASAKVAKVVFSLIPSPKYAGKRKWIVTYGIKEYKKQVIVPIGPADPAKVDGPPKPKDAAETALAGMLATVQKALGD